MELEDLISLICDEIVIYTDDGEGGFKDLYKGMPNETPTEMLHLDVRGIGAVSKNVIDIYV